MKQELCWLTLTVLLTSVMWVPYILNAFMTGGLMKTLTYDESTPPLAAWAQRAKKAHANAIENLAIFAPAVIIYMLVAAIHNNESIKTLIMVYFIARVIHYVGYIANVPFVRTVSFLTGWAMTIIILIKISTTLS